MMCDYQKLWGFRNIYKAHKAARRRKQGKVEVVASELDYINSLCVLQSELIPRNYTPKGFKHIKVYEPRERANYTSSYYDRVVAHCLRNNVLIPTLEPLIIYDNTACQKDELTHFAFDKPSEYVLDFYRKYGKDGYLLNCEIGKYSESTIHKVLKSKYRRVFSVTEICNILYHIIFDCNKDTLDIGLPLCNPISQWFASYYLDGVDHPMKEKLQIQYYIRHMDDFVLPHHVKEYLKDRLAKTLKFLRKRASSA